MLAAGTTHHPEPDVVVPVLGLVPVAVRGPQVPGLVPVGAPAQDAESAAQFSDLPGMIMPDVATVANRPTGA